MKCKYSENDLAFYVESDLTQAKMSELDAHLPLCDACRQLVQDLRETQSLFRSIRQDTVSAAALGSVRTKVLERVAAGSVRPSWGRWVYALAGASFAAVLCLGLWSIYPRQMARVEQAAVSSPLPPAEVLSGPNAISDVQSNRPVTVQRAKAGIRRRQQSGIQAEIPSEPPKEIVVKLLTDDPNVIIYWLVDQNGGSL